MQQRQTAQIETIHRTLGRWFASSDKNRVGWSLDFIAMAILNSDQDGVFKSLSDSPPAHCSLNIKSFSLITEYYPEDAYESGELEAGGYKWKLVLFLKGNKKKNAEDHVSLYLRIAGENSLQTGWKVYVDFRFFLLDQTKRAYLVFEDAFTKQKCFHGAMLDMGFDKLIPLDEFTDASRGYLIDDTCVFAAEVFVFKETRISKGVSVSRIQYPRTNKHVWKVENFSKLDAKCYNSEPFSFGTFEDQKWFIYLYPKGIDVGMDTHLSLYLAFEADHEKTSPPVTKVFAEFSLHIVDPKRAIQKSSPKVKYCFTAGGRGWGWPRFITQGGLRRFWKSDACSVEAEITVLGIARGPGDSGEKATPPEPKVVHRINEEPCNSCGKNASMHSTFKWSIGCFIFASCSALLLSLGKGGATWRLGGSSIRPNNISKDKK